MIITSGELRIVCQQTGRFIEIDSKNLPMFGIETWISPNHINGDWPDLSFTIDDLSIGNNIRVSGECHDTVAFARLFKQCESTNISDTVKYTDHVFDFACLPVRH